MKFILASRSPRRKEILKKFGYDFISVESDFSENGNYDSPISTVTAFARDVGLIAGTLEYKDNGIKRVENPILRYNVESVRLYDMFSQTKHVETVVLLTKK